MGAPAGVVVVVEGWASCRPRALARQSLARSLPASATCKSHLSSTTGPQLQIQGRDGVEHPNMACMRTTRVKHKQENMVKHSSMKHIKTVIWNSTQHTHSHTPHKISDLHTLYTHHSEHNCQVFSLYCCDVGHSVHYSYIPN